MRDLSKALRSIVLALLLSAIMSAISFGQTIAADDRLTSVREIQQLIDDGELTQAEQLIQKVFPSPLSDANREPGGIPISYYGLSWARLMSAFLSNGDYENAHRVAKERIEISDQLYGADHLASVAYVQFSALTYMKQRKYDDAIKLYRKSLAIYDAAGFRDDIVESSAYVMLSEALLLKGETEEALRLLEPVIYRMRGSVLEELYNTYVVVLREAGDDFEAERIEREVNLKSFNRPGVNERDRDFLRARVLSSRGSIKEAQAIYERWIKYWEDWGESVKDKEQEWDRILMGPLREYADFLSSNGKTDEAFRVRERLKAIQKKYAIRFP